MAAPNPTYTPANADPGWAARADVIYHFYAYHRFAPASDGLDIINLSDADVQYYNYTAALTRGLETQHLLATYLKENSGDDFRKSLILHVQAYNKTIAPRQRIYMLGLTSEDLQILNPAEKTAGTTNKKLMFASAGIGADGFRHLYHSAERLKETEGVEEVGVEEAVERCLRYFEESKAEKELVKETEKLDIGGGGEAGI